MPHLARNYIRKLGDQALVVAKFSRISEQDKLAALFKCRSQEPNNKRNQSQAGTCRTLAPPEVKIKIRTMIEIKVRNLATYSHSLNIRIKNQTINELKIRALVVYYHPLNLCHEIRVLNRIECPDACRTSEYPSRTRALKITKCRGTRRTSRSLGCVKSKTGADNCER